MQRLTLLETIVDEKMIDESCFLSPELKCGWLLIEIIGRLNSVQSKEGFHHVNFPGFGSEFTSGKISTKFIITDTPHHI